MKARHFKSRHALLMSLTSLMLCVSMLFGATFAWFTDSVTSGVNSIVSGNLDVELYHQNAETPARARVTTSTEDLFNAAIDNDHYLWEPGAVSYETFTVANEGNLALKYLFSLAKITQYNSVTWTDNSYEGAGDLTDVIKVAITEGTISGRDDALALFDEGNTIYGLSTAADVALQTAALGAGLEKTFTVVFYWEPDTTGTIDNRYNLRAIDGTDNWSLSDNGSELYIGVGVNLVATQYTNESDSFGIDYDAGAEQNWTVTTGVIAQAKVSDQAASEALTLSNNGTTVEIAAADVEESDSTSNTTVEYSMAVEVTDTNTAATAITVNDGQSATYLDIDVTKTTTTITTTNDETTTDTQSTSTFNNVVKVTTNIGSNKTGVAVYHNGVVMASLSASNTDEEGYSYDASTGILTIWSKSFSPFAVVYDDENSYGSDVIAIVKDADGTHYPTNEEELLAYEPTARSVQLVKDLTITRGSHQIMFTYPGTVSFDLNGNTVTGCVEAGNYISGSADTILTVTDSKGSGKIENEYTNVNGAMYNFDCLGAWQYGIIVNNGSYTQKSAQGVVINAQLQTSDTAVKTAFEINGGTFASAGTVICNVMGKTIINNGTFNAGEGAIMQVDSGDSYQPSEVVVNGGTFTGDYLIADARELSLDAHVTINDGTFNIGSGNWACLMVAGGDTHKVYTEINGGTFTFNGTDGHIYFADDSIDASQLVIKGGTFNVNPSAAMYNMGGTTHNFVAEGYTAHDNGNGTWTVVEAQ